MYDIPDLEVNTEFKLDGPVHSRHERRRGKIIATGEFLIQLLTDYTQYEAPQVVRCFHSAEDDCFHFVIDHPAIDILPEAAPYPILTLTKNEGHN